jgi:hypothetical protein
MMFDKQEQARRAAVFNASQQAMGAKKPVLPPIQVSKSAPMSASTWVPPIGLPMVKPLVAALAPPRRKESKMSVKYNEEPFVNEFHQVINPGEKIIAVKQGQNHSITVSEGVYLGLRRDSAGKVKNVTVRLKTKTRGYFMDDGTPAGANVVGAVHRTGIVDRRITLPKMRIYPTL